MREETGRHHLAPAPVTAVRRSLPHDALGAHASASASAEDGTGACWTTDRDLHLATATWAALERLSLSVEELGVSLFEYFGTDDPKHEAIAAHERALAGEPCEFRGSWRGRRFRARVEPLYGPRGQVVGVAGVALDGAKGQVREEALSARIVRAERQRAALLELTSIDDQAFEERVAQILRVDAATIDVERVSLWRVEPGVGVLRCAAQFTRHGGVRPGRGVREPSAAPHYFAALRAGDVIAAHDAVSDQRTNELFEERLAPLDISSTLDVPVLLKGEVVGVLCHEHVGGSRLWTYDEQQFAVCVGQMIALAYETQRREEIEAKLRHLAMHDPLTDLPNRVMLFDILARELGRAKRHEGYRFGLLFVDLDGFKEVNDTYGHQVGDRVLLECGLRLRACLRASDVAARFGGDEFAVVVSELREPRHAQMVAARIRAAFGEPMALTDHVVRGLEASIGWVVADGSFEDPSAIIRAADIGMYEEKYGRQNSGDESAAPRRPKSTSEMTVELPRLPATTSGGHRAVGPPDRDPGRR